jgi:hypothetical protein
MRLKTPSIQGFLSRSLTSAGAAALMLLTATSSPAIDVVHRKSNGKSVGGEITKVTRTEVVVTQKIGNKEDPVAANDVDHIEWDGEPAALKLARGSESNSNFAEALKQYQEASKTAGSARDDLKAEIEYGIVRSTAKLTMQTAGDLAPVVAPLKSFVNGHRDNYHFYDAQLLLGEVLLSAKDYLTSDLAFKSVSEAPWNDYQMAGKIGLARSALGQGQVPKAREIFDGVAATSTMTPAETSRKLEAMLGQAQCAMAEMKTEDALKIIQQVINDSTSADSRIEAKAYLLQGDAYRAANADPKDAFFSYLRVDVIPEYASESDLHAEALYQLSQIWGTVGNPAQGADALARLEASYPESEWAKKAREKK